MSLPAGDAEYVLVLLLDVVSYLERSAENLKAIIDSLKAKP